MILAIENPEKGLKREKKTQIYYYYYNFNLKNKKK